MNTFVKVILVLLFSVLIGTGVYYYKKYKYVSDAISFAFNNSLQCKKESCDKPIKNFTKIPHQKGNVYNKDVARYCTDLVSRIENGVETKKIATPDGLKLLKTVHNIPNTPVFGTILEQSLPDKKILWISFRGTIDTQEWVQDITYTQENFPNKKQVKLAFLNTHKKTTPSVHKGFVDAYMNFRDDIFKIINATKYESIIVSGHSLGAAISTIVGIDLANSGFPAIVYNFASPRVGDGNLCTMVNDLGLPIFRHVNTEDVIPTTPLAVSANFNDKTNPFMFNHCGEVLYFSTNWKSMINNHLLGIYINAFENNLYKRLVDKQK